MSNTTRNLIFNIYSHAMLAVSVLAVAVGTYMLIHNLTGRFVMSEYPLGYEETRCDYITNSSFGTAPNTTILTPEQRESEQLRLEEETRSAKAECMQELSQLRTKRAQSDLATAVNTLIVGTLLLIPHIVMVSRLNRRE